MPTHAPHRRAAPISGQMSARTWMACTQVPSACTFRWPGWRDPARIRMIEIKIGKFVMGFLFIGHSRSATPVIRRVGDSNAENHGQCSSSLTQFQIAQTLVNKYIKVPPNARNACEVGTSATWCCCGTDIDADNDNKSPPMYAGGACSRARWRATTEVHFIVVGGT